MRSSTGGAIEPPPVHWLLGTHPRLPLGARPLDVWRRGAHAELARLAGDA